MGLEGCRKLICVDAYFFRLFLGGQLLVVVGRDDNDYMYPYHEQLWRARIMIHVNGFSLS